MDTPLTAEEGHEIQPALVQTLIAVSAALQREPKALKLMRPPLVDRPIKRVMLIARIYEVFPLACRQCGGETRTIAFITKGAAIREILGHLGEPTWPSCLLPEPGPPLCEMPGAETPRMLSESGIEIPGLRTKIYTDAGRGS